MKKIISVLAMMAFASSQAFAQATPEATPATSQVPAAATPGLSVAAMVSIGVALAAVAAVASDDSETPSSHAHSSTTHHGR
jgi:hypothetical protein